MDKIATHFKINVEEVKKCVRITSDVHEITQTGVIEIVKSKIEKPDEKSRVLPFSTMSYHYITIGTSFKQINKLTIPDLKEALRNRKLPVGGKKQELIDRLSGYEEERRVKEAEIERKKPKIVLPPPDSTTIQGRNRILGEYTFRYELEAGNHYAKVTEIDFDPDNEPFDLLTTFRLAINVSYTSLLDLGEKSQYFAALIDSEDFWACRFLTRSNQVEKLARKIQSETTVSWRKLCELYRSPVFIAGRDKDAAFDWIRKTAWRSQADAPDDRPVLEINGDLMRAGGISYIGKLNNGVYVSFVDMYAGATAAHFGLTELRSIKIYDLEIDRQSSDFVETQPAESIDGAW